MENQREASRPIVAYLPLNAHELRTSLPGVMKHFFALGLRNAAQYQELVNSLYTADAVFYYPTATLNGLRRIRRFWVLFLVMRWLFGLDVHKLEVPRLIWDEKKLEAYLEVEAWHRSPYLSLLERLLGNITLTTFKVWSLQLFKFEEGADGALRICHQVELTDQFQTGIFMSGFYNAKVDASTLYIVCWRAVKMSTGVLLMRLDTL